MSGKSFDKEESKLDRLKSLLGMKISKPGAISPGSSKHAHQEFILTPELVKDIGSSSQTSHRLKSLKDLSEVVQNKVLEENGIEVVWECIKDLLKQPNPDERHFVVKFLCCLIKGQREHLGIMKAQFFHVIQHDLTSFDDLNCRIELLQALSCNGKELEYFEEEMGLLLQDLMKDVMKSKQKSEFYSLLINTVKFNAAHLNEDIITSFVLNTCTIASSSVSDEEIETCLRLLETMISFCYLPSESLCHVLICLCCVVNRQTCTVATWKLMKMLLGTHLGHTAIYQLCCILKESSASEQLLRGAVYFIGSALWGASKVITLRHPPSVVLPFFLESLKASNSDIVTNEVMEYTKRLVVKQSSELPLDTWDLILDIAEASLHHIESNANCHPELTKVVHELLTSLESLFEKGQFYGSADRLFAIMESCVSKRPEASVICLIDYRMKRITPLHNNWLKCLSQLVDVYFSKETRTTIRIKVLEILKTVVKSYKDLYQVELIEVVVIPHFRNIDSVPETDVKLLAVELVIDLAISASSHQFHDLLEIIEKVMNRQLVATRSPGTATKLSEGTGERVQKATVGPEVSKSVSGVIHVFQSKLFRMHSDHTLKTYELMIRYLRDLMKLPPTLLSQTGPLRKAIIECLLDLRADETYQVGLFNRGSNTVVYSSYINCCQRNWSKNRPLLPFNDAYGLLCQSLESDKDWNILSVILQQLPLLLRNKTLLSCIDPDGIERLSVRLYRMLSDRKLPEQFVNCSALSSKSDFHAFIFPVLTCLVSFHNQLDKNGQIELVRCLEFGLVSKCAQACLRGLTVCALEMQNTMMRQLPSVLQKLSQICATVSMAVPLMEFLSSLIHLPQLYSNFVEEQYKFVFAIALPYTNPFKYSHYTVSLAYHVIAMWFIKCRLPFRRGFVTYIMKGLKSNVLRQIEESESYYQRINQDSSDRNRTQSLNEEALRNDITADSSRRASQTAAKVRSAREVSIDQPTVTTATTPSIAAVPDQSIASNFHKELRDTCVDMLSRYVYFTSSSIPKRSHVADFLLSAGQNQSWLIGNSIVTITTSGGSKVGKSGLCEKCLSIARTTRHLTSSSDFLEQEQSDDGNRRRHKSAAFSTIKEDVSLIPLVSQDDMSLNRRHIRQSAENFTADDSSEANTDSLESSAKKIQAVDNVLMGLKAKPLEKSVFTTHICNCWCTQWAEVHIRRSTGNFSWMMRIQNEQDLVAMFPDFILSDISNLFKPFSEESAEPKKIDNSSVEENDYVRMMEEFFMSPADQRDSEDPSEKLKVDNIVLRSHSSPEIKLDQLAILAPSSSDHVTDESSDNRSIRECPKSILVNRSVSVGGADAERRCQMMDDKTSASAELRASFEPTHPKREQQRPRSGILCSVLEESDLAVMPSLRHSVQETKSFASMSEVKSKQSSTEEVQPLPTPVSHDSVIHGGVNPTFLFLQLFHNQCFGTAEDSVLPLPMNETNTQSLKLLDLIFPYETHKIGVIYVKPGQTKNELGILSNMHGSTRYMAFLDSLGQLLRLSDCNPLTTYLGGLDTKGTDGLFAYAWHADLMQVIFHVVTLMPFIEHDKQFTEKKKHIGNDFVTIVYNDSGEDYRMGTIKGQFNFVNIIIKPLDYGTNEVTVQTKPEIEDMIAHKDTKIISDSNLGLLVRQMAVHANLASTIYMRQKVHPLNPYASNWLERLRRIKLLRERLLQERSKLDPDAKLSDDFSIFSQ